MTAWIEIIGYAFKFLWAFFGIWTDWKKEKAAIGEATRLSDEAFQVLVVRTIERLRVTAKTESEQAQAVESELERKKKEIEDGLK